MFMEKYKVFVTNASKEIEVDATMTLEDLSKSFRGCMKGDILTASVNNTVLDLNTKINSDCTVEFYDITSRYGFKAYQRSVSLLMLAAANEVLGNEAQIWVQHTINQNYYCELHGAELTEALLEELENKMQELVKSAYDIERIILPIDEAKEIFRKYGLKNALKTLKYVKSSTVAVYKLGKFYDYLYGVMVPNTSYLKVFKLTKFGDGFTLQFASVDKPDTLNEARDYPKLAQVFCECTKWSRILEVDTVGSLNDKVCRGEVKDIIWTAEGLHEKKIADIADKIAQKNRRLIMIAGPSSSGKTTFAKRLCIQLRVAGLKPYAISLDDYYKNREEIPIEADGKRNFERLEALDVALFNKDLQSLLDGKTVQMPTYNFFTGCREYKGNSITLKEGEVLVVEGIHGINEKLTPDINKGDKFKVYISALTQLNLDEHNRISTSDTRLIRRIVRDNMFRGFGAKSTIDMWPTVLKGEELNIFPYQEEADVMFNSALVYELSVLKPFIEPVLFGIDKNDREYAEASRLLNFLNNFVTISPSDIPTNSIIREFIGGSCFY
jgi:uridine kinase